MNRSESPKLQNRFRTPWFRFGLILVLLLTVAALVLTTVGLTSSLQKNNSVEKVLTLRFIRSQTAEEEGYDEDSTLCRVDYTDESEQYSCSVTYPYEEWEELEEGHSIERTVVVVADGAYAVFDHADYTEAELTDALREARTLESKPFFNAAMAVFLLAVGVGVMTFFGNFFTTYEKIWFLSILALASLFAVLFPEEDVNGISGIAIMGLYLLDTFLNILCELLISKQSKWNFIVSVFVEIAEILICVLLAYRFATMATTLFFWLPVDIISFINWHRHPDREEEELTEVRTLRGWQEVLLLAGIVVWTVGIGYLLSGLDISTDLFGGNKVLETVVCYMDACASAVGIANGLFILFRFREQWIAWYICAVLEAVINILSGQYVLLVLKLGYITNTTYGYIKWTGYIRSHEKQKNKKNSSGLPA